MDFFKEIDADVFCIQETKMQPGQLEIETPGYYQYMNSAEKKGYSGTMVFSKQKPLSVTYGLGIEEHDHEGRVITCEYEDFYLVCVYTPNSKDGLLRLDYRMVWEDAFRAYLHKLNETKSVLVCGDLNVAHKEIDLKNPKTNRRNAGFTDEERGKMSVLLESGFDICIQSRRGFIPGGAIGSKPAKRMQGGGLTISWFPRMRRRLFGKQGFTRISMAVITARYLLNLIRRLSRTAFYIPC